MRIDMDVKTLSLRGAGLGIVVAAAIWAAPAALADPAAPAPPALPPAPVVAAATDVAAPAPDPLAFLRPPAPAEAPAGEVPHLPTPEHLPPGSTLDPAAKSTENPNVSYLKDLWQAVQSQEISGKDAIIMGLAQRGMGTPYPDQTPGPTVPLSPADAAAAPPAPAPAPPPAPLLP